MPPKRERHSTNPLDKIPEGLAGCMKVDTILRWAKEVNQKWSLRLEGYLDPSLATADNWCGWDGTPSGPSEEHTSSVYEKSLTELAEIGVLRRVERPEETNQIRVFASYFQVKKNAQVDRAIQNCCALKARTKPPFPLYLIRLRQLFQLVDFFEKPHFSWMDLRHWFYQITLPNAVRKLFSIRAGSKQYELRVWPMGFTFTPAISQTIVSIILCQAVRRIAVHQELWIDNAEADFAPPFLIVKTHSRGVARIVAFIIAWYDNIVVIAENNFFVRCITPSIVSTLGLAEVIIKKVGDEQQDVFYSETLEFLGMNIKKDATDGRVIWNHIPSNQQKWALHELPTPRMPCTPRLVSELSGVIMWDWNIRGGLLGEVRHVIELMRVVGRESMTQESYDTTKRFDTGLLEKLRSDFLEIATKSPTTYSFPPVPSPNLPKIWAASDSSGEKAAGVTFTMNAVETNEWVIDWEGEAAEKPINWKETRMAQLTLEHIVKKEMPSEVEIIFAVDNSTAKAALRTGMYREDETMSAWLYETLTTLSVRRIVLI